MAPAEKRRGPGAPPDPRTAKETNPDQGARRSAAHGTPNTDFGTGVSIDQWQTLSLQLGRNRTPELLWSLWPQMPPDVLAYAVPDAWSIAEFPQTFLPRTCWQYLFERAGFTHDMVPAERPTEPLRVWRGAGRHYQRRWSWSTDREQAEWFARRMAGMIGEARVWTTLAPPTALLAIIHEGGRHESEVVVNTAGLRIEAASNWLTRDHVKITDGSHS